MKINVSEDIVAYFGAICMGLSLGGIRISMAVSNILTVVAGLCMVWYLYKTNFRSLKTLPKWYWLPLVIFAFCLIPALVNSEEMRLALRYYGNNVFYRPLGYFVFILMLRDKPSYVMQALIIAFILFGFEALYSCYMHSMGIDPRSSGFNFDQPTSPFTTCICVYMACTIVYALDDAFAGKWRYFGIGIFILSWIALLANDCRTGFVTAIILIIVLSSRYIIRSKQKMLCVGLFFVLAVSFFYFHPHYHRRIFSVVNTTTDMSNYARINLWKDSFVMWKDHPITGVGLRSWGKVYEQKYYVNSAIKNKIGICYVHPHNNFILMLVEGGLIGLFGFILLLGGYIYHIGKEFGADKNPFWLMALGILLAYIICGCFDSILWFSTPNRTFWTMLGMVMALAEGSRIAKSKELLSELAIIKFTIAFRLSELYYKIRWRILWYFIVLKAQSKDSHCDDYSELPILKLCVKLTDEIFAISKNLSNQNALIEWKEVYEIANALSVDFISGYVFSSVDKYKQILKNMRRKCILLKAKIIISERLGYVDVEKANLLLGLMDKLFSLLSNV